MTHDSLKEAFVCRDATLTRLQLDGRNSDASLPTFWGRVKTMFNDAGTVVFKSVAIPSWSETYFGEEHKLSDPTLVTLVQVTMPIEDEGIFKASYMKINNLRGSFVSRNGDEMKKKKTMDLGEAEADPASLHTYARC